MREVSFVATRRCGAPYRRLLYFFCYFTAPTRASHIISSYWVIGWKHSRDVESEIFWYFFSMFRFICHEKSFLLFLRQRLAFFWVLLSRARRWHFLCLISKPSSKKTENINLTFCLLFASKFSTWSANETFSTPCADVHVHKSFISKGISLLLVFRPGENLNMTQNVKTKRKIKMSRHRQKVNTLRCSLPRSTFIPLFILVNLWPLFLSHRNPIVKESWIWKIS